MKNNILSKITIIFLLLLSLAPTPSIKEVQALSNYLTITRTRTLDINYNIIQAQSGVNIVQVRVGNNVINEVEGWGLWTDITDATGAPIVGGLLVGTATVKNWELPALSANTETKVCIQLRDSSGRETPWDSNCGFVFWDINPPVQGNLLINDGLTWDNDWNIPIYAQVSDPSGINSNTGFSISENGGPFISLPGAVCSYDFNTKLYNCTLNTTYNADRTRSSSTIELRICDNLNNCTTSPLTAVTFSGVVPTGSLSILQATEASNLVNVDYSVADSASGIQMITLENVTTNPGNVNREVIFLANGTWPSSLSGSKKGYALTEKSGIVKMTVFNRAGSSSTFYSNSISANRIGFESTVINKVINPNKYTLSSPFTPILVDFSTPLENMPEAVTGGNIAVTQNFYWDSSVTDLSGFYQYRIQNSSGYVQYETKQFGLSDLIINGNNAILVMETTIDKSAPISFGTDITYVSLQVEMYVTINGVTNSVPLYFPARNEYYNVARITGGIDDSINYESRN